MILVDTSIWVDHFRAPIPVIARIIQDEQLLMHPLVIAELDLGFLPRRAETLIYLDDLPVAPVARIEEVRVLIAAHALHGRGIGVVDAHLLSSARIHQECLLWTRDKRLRAVAQELGVSADLP